MLKHARLNVGTQSDGKPEQLKRIEFPSGRFDTSGEALFTVVGKTSTGASTHARIRTGVFIACLWTNGSLPLNLHTITVSLAGVCSLNAANDSAEELLLDHPSADGQLVVGIVELFHTKISDNFTQVAKI